jgi:hypothetical protein
MSKRKMYTKTNLIDRLEVLYVIDDTRELRQAELDMMFNHWIESPKTLLNYRGLPIHRSLLEKEYSSDRLTALQNDLDALKEGWVEVNQSEKKVKELQSKIKRLRTKLSKSDWDLYKALIDGSSEDRYNYLLEHGDDWKILIDDYDEWLEDI